MTDVTSLSAVEAAERVRAGDLAPAEVFAAYRGRAAADELNAFVWVADDTGDAVDPKASPLGGVIPVDPLSMRGELRTPDDDRMLTDEDFREKLTHSRAIADLDFAAYDNYLSGKLVDVPCSEEDVKGFLACLPKV